MKRAFLALISLAALTGMAAAADLPPRPAPAPYYKAPVMAPIYNWTGFYIGINGGGGFGRSAWDPTGGFNTSGGLVGGTIGYNYQAGQAVFGLEGDIDWANINGTSTSGLCSPAGFSCTTKNTWLSTVRGRAGFAADRILFYGTAGGAFGEIQESGAGLTSNNFNRFGWTAGAGLEGALTDNLTARIEYLYVDLGSGSCTLVCFGTTTNVSFKTSLVRAGLDFKFGGF
jgi:outer membrane immunogenic protein